jgi:hypothetical protein
MRPELKRVSTDRRRGQREWTLGSGSGASRAVPKDLPPRSTLFDYLDMWCYDGTLDRIHHALYVGCREKGEREASPTAAIIDSQSVKSAEKGGLASIRMAMTRARRSRARSAKFS